jgi:phage shock protein C
MSIDMDTQLTQHPQPVRVRRSTTDKVIAGVAGGLGRYLGIDPVILRIAFVLLALSGGSGVLLYIIGWIAIPQEQPNDVLGPIPSGSA